MKPREPHEKIVRRATSRTGKRKPMLASLPLTQEVRCIFNPRRACMRCPVCAPSSVGL